MAEDGSDDENPKPGVTKCSLSGMSVSICLHVVSMQNVAETKHLRFEPELASGSLRLPGMEEGIAVFILVGVDFQAHWSRTDFMRLVFSSKSPDKLRTHFLETERKNKASNEAVACVSLSLFVGVELRPRKRGHRLRTSIESCGQGFRFRSPSSDLARRVCSNARIRKTKSWRSLCFG